MTYLSKLKEEHKKLIPYITDFFSELLSKEYSKMAATMEFPIPEEDDIPEELESIVGKVKGPLSYFDENIKCVKGILGQLSLYKAGYTLDDFSEDRDYTDYDFERLVRSRSIVGINMESSDFNLPKYPFEDENGKPVYQTFLDMDGEGYWGYTLLIKPDEGAVMVLHYTDPVDGHLYSKEECFEAVTYNFKTNELSLSYLAECEKF